MTSVSYFNVSVIWDDLLHWLQWSRLQCPVRNSTRCDLGGAHIKRVWMTFLHPTPVSCCCL